MDNTLNKQKPHLTLKHTTIKYYSYSSPIGLLSAYEQSYL